MSNSLDFNDIYRAKYLKYKQKYLNLRKNILSGGTLNFQSCKNKEVFSKET